MVKFTVSHHLIHWWKGTDSLKLIMYPPTLNKVWYVRIFLERIIFKCTEWMIREHWVDHQCLVSNLVEFGVDPKKILVRYDYIWTETIKKRKHSKFMVLYYEYHGKNKYFKDWLYGNDIIKSAIKHFENNKQIAFRSITNRMTKRRVLELLAVTDAYIRPNRHDGNSRLRLFCKINNISVYHTRQEESSDKLIRWLEYEFKAYNNEHGLDEGAGNLPKIRKPQTKTGEQTIKKTSSETNV